MNTGIRTMQDLRNACSKAKQPKGVQGQCLVWTGATYRTGSPSVWIPALRRAGSLSALVKTISNKKIEDGLVHLSRCGDQSCCNPEHREWRPISEARKLAQQGKKRNAMHCAKIAAARIRGSHITPEMVRKIRETKRGHVKAVAAEIGVSHSWACTIWRNKGRKDADLFSATVQMLAAVTGGAA